jgi:starch phosphorylase
MTNSALRTTVAYFTMEAALESEMPTYSGGLGVLAGDTLRAAADHGVGMVGVTMLYRYGFFRQHLDAEGRQAESSYNWDPAAYLQPLDVRVTIELEGRQVVVTAWQYLVQGVRGNLVPVILLDTDLAENTEDDRGISAWLYGGDQRYRLKQEAVLGLAGVPMLQSLGYNDIETFHMNEGHCALLTLALLEQASPERDVSQASPDDIGGVRERCVFTTHTPVPAGHDRFHIGLVYEVLGECLASAIERLPFYADDTLNMTHLGLFFSRFANAVAWRHGETARAMYPSYRIYSITNGVHAETWAADANAALYDRWIPQWRIDKHSLRQALTVPLEHIQEAHALAKLALLEEIEKRTGRSLDPSVFTIGFARRAATYKRADLVFSDLDRLRAIARDVGPLQFIFAGKAHPHDDPGKALIERVFQAQELLSDTIPVVYLEEHDMALGRFLCSGVDLWLNNPQKPQEASGTSGMKAAINGVPSFSVLDGWWPEGWVEGVTGWAIGESISEASDWDYEAGQLYEKLQQVIVPLYYNTPDEYARIMRSTLAINGSYFTAQRMIEQYVANAYTPRSEGRV